MKDNIVRKVLILGTLAIIGIVIVQSYWLLRSWDLKDSEFNLSVNIALKNVANSIARYNSTALPKKNLIQRQSSNYYAVNINSAIDANILEDYLYRELGNVALNTDFEYAVYDCANSELVYGNYCKMDSKNLSDTRTTSLPKFNDLIYYFVVKFPSRESYLLTNLKTNLIFAGVAVLSVLFFTYSMFVILKQKRLSELQKDFINNMTHEFKTPISSIKIASAAIANHNSVAANPKLSKYINIISNQNERLNDQVEKVLNIARLENDKLKINRISVDLSDLIQNIATSENMKAHREFIQISKPDHPVHIQADETHLANVVYNLLDNAVKYCKTDPLIKLRIKETSNTILLECEDNGIGISPAHQKLIFDKFYRVSTGNIHDIKGFGLGLFYVKSIVDSHGWKISLDSEEGKGTTFIIEIPKTD